MQAAGKTEPATGLEGKFSISYCVANALLRGVTGMQAFTDEKVNDPAVRAIMKKIKVINDPEIKALEVPCGGGDWGRQEVQVPFPTSSSRSRPWRSRRSAWPASSSTCAGRCWGRGNPLR
ncbi:MAG: MmgE/PrpD family protein [Desulfobacterales bacterium]|nr:MmgE/PrpD family protein [Desulfobacterales bacterium]